MITKCYNQPASYWHGLCLARWLQMPCHLATLPAHSYRSSYASGWPSQMPAHSLFLLFHTNAPACEAGTGAARNGLAIVVHCSKSKQLHSLRIERLLARALHLPLVRSFPGLCIVRYRIGVGLEPEFPLCIAVPPMQLNTWPLSGLFASSSFSTSPFSLVLLPLFCSLKKKNYIKIKK